MRSSRSLHCVIRTWTSIPPRHLPLLSLSLPIQIPRLTHNTSSITSKYSRAITITPPTMSDSNYLSFLEKANADLNAEQPHTESQSQSQTKTLDADAQIPASLTSVDAYYISDADEPFEPVVLRWDGAADGTWPDSCMSFPPPPLCIYQTGNKLTRSVWLQRNYPA